MSRRSVVPDFLPENEPGYRRYVVLGWLGETLMTLGAVALLLCVYQLVWTNVAADRTATSVINDLVTEWEQAPPHPSAVPTQGGSPGSSGPTTATGAVGGGGGRVQARAGLCHPVRPSAGGLIPGADC